MSSARTPKSRRSAPAEPASTARPARPKAVPKLKSSRPAGIRTGHGIKEASLRLPAILDAAPQMVFIKDPRGRYLYANPEFRRVMGGGRAVVGLRDLDLFTREQCRRFHATDRQVRAHGQTVQLEETLRRGGGLRTYLVTKFPLREPGGEILGVCGMATDITDRKCAEMDLRYSEERWRLMVSNVLDYAIFMLDPQGRVTTWNAGAQRINGYSAPEILGQPLSIFYPPAEVTAGKPQLELEVASAVGRFEDEGWRVRKDGSLLWANVILTALRDGSGVLRGFAKITRDLTERRRAERELLARDARLMSLIENSPTAIVYLDAAGAIELVNRAFERLIGYEAGEVRGERVHEALADPGAGAEWERVQPRLRAGESVQFLTRLRHRSERTLEVESQLVPVLEDGALAGVYALFRDLTEQKRQLRIERENRELELHAREIERAMRLKSELLATASHDLRTPLTAILGFSDLLLEDLGGPLTAEQRRYTEHIHSAGDFLLRLLNDLLDLSKLDSGQIQLSFAPVDLGPVVRDVLATLQPLAEARELQLDAELPAAAVNVRADAMRLRQILFNLLSNALKFTPAGGRVRVAALPESGGSIRVRVTDTGIGVAPDALPHIFDEFYQADKSGNDPNEGSGLGLAITRRLVERHGGRIEVASEPGRGTEFTFWIPAAEPVPENLPIVESPVV